MLDFKFFSILKKSEWTNEEIDNFSNHYNDFLEKNEPNFTLFMHYLKEKEFNKTTDELINIYAAYKMPTQTKINTNNQAQNKKDEEKNNQELQNEEEIEIEDQEFKPAGELKKDIENAKSSLRRFKKLIAKKEENLKNETDPAKQEELKKELEEYKKNAKQLFTERINKLKTKHGSIKGLQKKIVDFDKFYTPNVENVEVKNNEDVVLNAGYRNFQDINNLKSIKNFKDERTTNWKNEHKKGFILTQLSPKLDVKKAENPDLLKNLARAANAVKQAAFEYGVNSEEYQMLAQQYLDTQKETLGRRTNRKIKKDLGKECILKSGNHIEIPEFLLNMTIAKTK